MIIKQTFKKSQNYSNKNINNINNNNNDNNNDDDDEMDIFKKIDIQFTIEK